MGMTATERGELAHKLRAIFKPGTPINRFDLFMGRQPQSRKLVSAINQNGQHAILFGERGVGKTSLANVLMSLARTPGWPLISPIINVTRQDSYSDVWGRVFVELHEKLKKEKLSLPRSVAKYAKYSSEGIHEPISADVVCRFLSAAAENATIVPIIDEFDMLRSDDARGAMADTVKYLSDRNVPCTVILIGVSDDVEGLISEHQSIERCLIPVRMPRMSRDEIEEIVKKTLFVAGMSAESSALHEISRICKGLPHYAHLLGLHSALCAVEAGALTVTQRRVSEAVAIALDDVQLLIQNAYTKATDSSQRNAQYREVLLGCALAETNEYGYFSPADVRGPLSRVLKRDAAIEAFSRHLHAFCEERFGPVLKCWNVRNRPRFRFVQPLMQPYVIMKGLSDGMFSETDLQETRDPRDPQKRLF
jgi:Cdc6-like AAA superfamily ATPase